MISAAYNVARMLPRYAAQKTVIRCTISNQPLRTSSALLHVDAPFFCACSCVGSIMPRWGTEWQCVPALNGMRSADIM